MPHAHAPVVQRSDRESHAAQLMPAAPHAVADCEAAETQVFPEQQPVEQLEGVQTQVPFAQTCPAPHAAPAPHRHAPPVQAFVVPVQAEQAAPPVPHAAAVCAVPTMHAPALQQPVGQLAALHTQAPPTQRNPAPHAAPVPQRQAPEVQRSPASPQLEHAAPAAPQAVALVGVQTLPTQHPLGQLVASQTHAPPTHRCPEPHAAPAPHAQAPLRQLSEAGAPHAAQVAPAVPHVVVAFCRHVPARQQPVGQFVASQPEHVFAAVQVDGHVWHATPPVPHAVAALPAWQTPFASQQPLGQLAAVHTHSPATHSWPAEHTPFLPHAQPEVPQVSE